MMINGNRLVELTPAELDLLRDLLTEEADNVDDGSTVYGDWTADDLRSLGRRLGG